MGFPAERMKLRKEHVVPLSKQCLDIIELMQEYRDKFFKLSSMPSSALLTLIGFRGLKGTITSTISTLIIGRIVFS